MRILLITSGASSLISGSNKIIMDIIEGLIDLGCDVLLLGSVNLNKEFWYNNTKLKGNLYNINLSTIDPVSLMRIFQVIRSYKPDIIFTHDRRVDIALSFFSNLFKIPQVVTVHGFLSLFTESDLIRKSFLHSVKNNIWFFILKSVDAVVAISNSAGKETRVLLGSKNIRIIRNGIDTKKYKPICYIPSKLRRKYFPRLKSRFIITFAGRLDKEKRPELLITLITLLRKKGCDCKGVFAGLGRSENVLRIKAVEMGVEDDIEFLGNRNDMECVYNCSDIIAHFHPQEAFGLVIAEAMSCGRPVVAFNGGALDELIDEGKNGYLINDYDINKMAMKILDLYNNRIKWRKFATNSRKKAITEFDIKNCVLKYDEMFSELMQNK